MTFVVALEGIWCESFTFLLDALQADDVEGAPKSSIDSQRSPLGWKREERTKLTQFTEEWFQDESQDFHGDPPSPRTDRRPYLREVALALRCLLAPAPLVLSQKLQQGMLGAWLSWFWLTRRKPKLFAPNVQLPPGEIFAGLHLRGALLQNARIPESNWNGAALEAANLDDADLTGSTFVGASLKAASLVRSKLKDGRFKGANLDQANLNEGELSSARFTAASMKEASLKNAKLQSARFENAMLGGAIFDGADLTEAKLTTAFLRAASLVGTCLEGADLSGAYLVDAVLSNADLRGANLRAAALHGAVLSGAKYDSRTCWPKGFRPDAYGAVPESKLIYPR